MKQKQHLLCQIKDFVIHSHLPHELEHYRIFSAVLLFVILQYPSLDLVGNFVWDNSYLKGFAAGLQWQTLLRLRIFSVRSPEGKEIPVGVEILWGRVARIFESRIAEREETGLFEFLLPYRKKHVNLDDVKKTARDYVAAANLDVGEKARLRKIFDDATNAEELMSIFIRLRGVRVFQQRFPL